MKKKSILKKQNNLLMVFVLFLILISPLFLFPKNPKIISLKKDLELRYLLAIGKYETCEIEQLNLEFSCPSYVSIEYWPDLYSSEWVTVRNKSIGTDKLAEKDLYATGFFFSRRELPSYVPSGTETAEYFSLEEKEEARRVKAGSLPTTGLGIPKVVTSEPAEFPAWTGEVSTRIIDFPLAYYNVKDNYLYGLEINEESGFTAKELEIMFSTLRWANE